MHDIEVEEGVDFEKYMIMMGLPTCVLIAGFGMWLFVTINKIDLSSIKNGNLLEKILLIKESHLKTKSNKDYDHLPQFNTELDEPKHD